MPRPALLPQNDSSTIQPLLNNTRRPRPIGGPSGEAVITLRRYFESGTYIYYGTVLPVISAFVITINVLLIATLIKGNFRKSTHMMMIAMATADSLTGLVPLPFNIYVFGLQNQKGFLTVTWCYIYEYMLRYLPEILHISSLHLTVGLGIERFIVVAFPLRAKSICTLRNGIISSITIFVLSICSQIDLFTQASFESFSVTLETNEIIAGCIRSAIVRTNIEYCIRIAFLVFAPCLSLITFTAMLLKKSKEIQQWRRQNSSNTNSLERLDLAVTLIMVFVVLSEMTVWTALILSRVYDIRFTRTHSDMNAFGFIIFQITSPITFVILCFLSAQFRNTFRKMFCCCTINSCCIKHFAGKPYHIPASGSSKTGNKKTENTKM